MPLKKCSNCKKIKLFVEFYNFKHGAGGKQSRCKECSDLTHKGYIRSNRNKISVYSSSNRQKNRFKPKNITTRFLDAIKNRLARKKRTPKWLTSLELEHIKIFYEAAAQLTKETGIPHEVDHIIPLRGRIISGLHVPSNLQVLTKEENRLKCNKFKYK